LKSAKRMLTNGKSFSEASSHITEILLRYRESWDTRIYLAVLSSNSIPVLSIETMTQDVSAVFASSLLG